MITFKHFILEGTLKSSGPDSERHAKKYIEPYIGQDNTHTLKTAHGPLEAGSKVTVHGHVLHNGKYHAIVSGEGSSEKHVVPFSKILKPTTKKENKGFEYEDSIVNHLNKHGLMKGSGAGATAGNDIHLINKKRGVIHKGRVTQNLASGSGEIVHQGEVKKDLGAAFGQASLKHHPEKGWHFDEKTKKRFPEFTSSVENTTITVNGKKKKLLNHINDTISPDEASGTKKTSKNIYSDHTDLTPMHSYLHDHNVEVLHVGSHGTFRAGRSQHKDSTGIGLPEAKGEGRFRVRQKHPKTLTVQFNVKKLGKSHFNLDNDDDIEKAKKALGHT